MSTVRGNTVSQATSDDAIEALFEEIANTAYLTEERLKVTPTDDSELQAHELDVLRRIVRRLGWIADMGLHRVGSNRTIHEGDAVAWLLSPYTNECLAQKMTS
ncbi:MAG: hypothetical protein EOP13_06290 [Pseudomonas sp.]|uniref:hypothetical protein n=1 Tax=Pseudomonas sp. TaxID=306 RepID=UPI001220CD82|nr:hypothetical protein [Pseudomonas sp.]RZI75179.1 MAG: hypothetical protein EOP13_06290 [Pseudomonas sp.]